MAKPTIKKKAMTLEDFAAAVHEDYLAIRKDMATKADLWPMQRDIKTLDTNVREHSGRREACHGCDGVESRPCQHALR